MDDPEIRGAFGMIENEKVYGPILMGFPQENLPPRQPKNAPMVKVI